MLLHLLTAAATVRCASSSTPPRPSSAKAAGQQVAKVHSYGTVGRERRAAPRWSSMLPAHRGGPGRAGGGARAPIGGEPTNLRGVPSQNLSICVDCRPFSAATTASQDAPDASFKAAKGRLYLGPFRQHARLRSEFDGVRLRILPSECIASMTRFLFEIFLFACIISDWVFLMKKR